MSDQSVALLTDNATIVTSLRHQAEVVLWAERRLVSLMASCIPGKNTVFATQLSLADQILPMEWSTFPRVFKAICGVFGRSHLALFATHANAKLPLYVSQVADPRAWKQDMFQHPWDHLSAYAFPPFALLRQVLLTVLLSIGLSLVLVALLWPHKGWFADLLSLLVHELLGLPQV